MSAVFLHRLLGLCLLLAALALLVAGVLALTLPAVGERLLTTWPVVIDAPRVVQLSEGPVRATLAKSRTPTIFPAN